jgi:hypothetical protein
VFLKGATGKLLVGAHNIGDQPFVVTVVRPSHDYAGLDAGKLV